MGCVEGFIEIFPDSHSILEMIKRCFTPGLTLVAVLVLSVCLCGAREETMGKEVFQGCNHRSLLFLKE